MTDRPVLERLIRKLCYDDALLFTNWYSVEYLHLDRGLPQYRVYFGESLVAVMHIRHPARLRFVQPALAYYLAGKGCDPDSALLLEGGALTPPDAKVRDLPVLRLQMPRRDLL
jgi:hypothetical protein